MKAMTQKQVVVPPESATFQDLHKPTGFGVAISKHYGEVLCPCCGERNIVAGPYKGAGSAWLFSTCDHAQGIAAGHGFDITILFKGGAA